MISDCFVRKPLILAHGAKLCLRNRTHVYRSLAGIYFFIGGWMYIHIWVAVVRWLPPPVSKKCELVWIACGPLVRDCRWSTCPGLPAGSRVGFLLFLDGGMHSATDYVTGYVSQYRVRKKSEESYRFSVKTLKLCFYRKANCLTKQTKKP